MTTGKRKEPTAGSECAVGAGGVGIAKALSAQEVTITSVTPKGAQHRGPWVQGRASLGWGVTKRRREMEEPPAKLSKAVPGPDLVFGGQGGGQGTCPGCSQQGGTEDCCWGGTEQGCRGSFAQ